MNNSGSKNITNLDAAMTGSKVDGCDSQQSLRSSDASQAEDTLPGKNGKPPQRASAKRSGGAASRAQKKTAK